MPRFALALFLLALAGCAPEPGDVRDDPGRAVALDGTPRRVVPLAPNVTELVAAAAGVGRLVGVATSDDAPAGIGGLPRFQSVPLDVEAVVALRPDLAIGSDDVTPSDVAEGLGAVGVPTFLFRFDEVADVPRALRALDTLLAVSGGAPVADDFERRVGAVEQAVRPFSAPRVLLLVGAEEGTLYAFGRDSYASEMVRLAGGQNLTDRFEGAASSPSEEVALEMAPEVIVVAGDQGAADAFVAAHPALLTTPAVANGRVYGLDADLVLRPGPRLVEGLERLARLLHPQAFASGAA